MNQYRQGDVLIVEVKSIPKEVKERKQGVLVEGEVTGHAHRIAPNDLTKAKVGFMDEPQRLFVEAIENIRIVHEDHATIELPAGRYELLNICGRSYQRHAVALHTGVSREKGLIKPRRHGLSMWQGLG